MSVSWEPQARALLVQGYSYSQIGKALNRSPTRVHRVLNPKEYNAGPRPPHVDSELTKKRRLLRRWCRRAAARENRPVDELYRQYGCENLDRVALWEEKDA